MTRSLPSHQRQVVNALTIDVEDWFHGFDLSPRRWFYLEPRLSIGLSRLLELLDAHRVRATFFVLGALVDEWRDLLGQVADAGHEIACHGYWHIPLYRLRPAEFERHLARALRRLGAFTRQPITSYRAPFFSITQRSLWALPRLARAGLRRDSSILPVHNPRYGIPYADRFPHVILAQHARTAPAYLGLERVRLKETWHLCEYPVSTLALGKLNLPFGGGFYARLLPYVLIRRAVKQLNARGQPAIFYFHPWELDPEQPRLRDGVPLLYHFTHYYGLRGAAAKLEALLKEFAFGPLCALDARLNFDA